MPLCVFSMPSRQIIQTNGICSGESMKDVLVKMLSVFVLASVSGSVLADKGSSATIDYMQPSSNGQVFVALESGSMPGCYENRGALISRETSDGSKNLYAALLAAKMANKSVTPVYSIVGSDPARWGRCELKALFIN